VHDNLSSYLEKARQKNMMRQSFGSIAACLSLLVILCVFWHLKMTGITMAGEAFCGNAEHVHSEECVQKDLICEIPESEEHAHSEECYSEARICELEEHVHIESCYSDITADVETSDDWEMSFAALERGSTTAENIVILARSQLGVTESELNFEVGADGVRRGITRYGQWYGNPYGDWSAMFTSFCLYYAGAEDVPSNAGPETMRLAWETEGLYKPAAEYGPMVGNIVFLNNAPPGEEAADEAFLQYTEGKTVATSVAVIAEVGENGITVIEGDVDGAVSEVIYSLDGEEIIGYGLVPEVSEFVPLVEAPVNGDVIAATARYETSMLTSSSRFVLYTVQNGVAYAIDGTGGAVPVYVDENGKIRSDAEDPEMLLWTFSRYNNNSSAIQNVGSGRYLHPYYNGANDNGITTPGRWGTTVNASGDGVKLVHSAYVGFDSNTGQFYMTRTQGQNVTFNIGVSSPCTVWFDGTNGGIMSLGGSDDTAYTVYTDSTMTLPAAWKSPVKYNYVLKGWYDITNHKYYAPGDKVTVSGNTVFYADWKAATYDIGEFNSHVTDTVSTNSFVTTRLFDYGALMNVLSERVEVTVNADSHSEEWYLLTSGNNPYNGEPTFGFIMRDWDRGNEDISYPNNHDDVNNPTDAGTVYQGLYTDEIRDALFDPDIVLPGKEYIGTADHLFQLCEDPSHEHFGYYYYNSERNAAAYNQSDGRFYIYDYLECTRDSYNSGDEGKYSDFLPLNSSYENTNGKNPVIYSYQGIEGEYVGTAHYMYDSRYNDNDNSTNNVGTNFWFGMSIDISFYLPNAPGATVADGGYGNKDVYGEDMHFRFTGDDDVWIFVDDKLVLDLGGLHGRETGDINFATGEVTINGVVDQALSRTLKSVTAGEHTLTMYYLERGSSMSNCAIYFNLAPRFYFSIQKEDVLTKDVLNGAEFSVYTDAECTVPAQLWRNKEAHDNKESPTNTFTVVDGIAEMWGMGAGNVYYIKETGPPDDPNYGLPNGIISLTFDKMGTASYNVDMIEDESGVSPGFIVHGFRIDTETQMAYIVATNAPKWVKETTTVDVFKHWNDSLDHSDDAIIVYLTVTSPDGTVTRLQEMVIGAENGWKGRFENLPKYAEDGKTPIEYGVEETYVSGYYSKVEKVEDGVSITEKKWTAADTFVNGNTYLIKNSSGLALSTQRSAEDTGYMWVSENEAKNSALARWKASVKGSTVRFTNEAGQTITFYYGNGRPTDFYAFNQHVEDNNRKQYFSYEKTNGGIRLKYNNYYLGSSLNSSSKFTTSTSSSGALIITPFTEQTFTTQVNVQDNGFLITNTPLERETSLSVTKDWVIPPDMDASVYEKEQVTVKLYANGADTGRTVTLTLKNGWADTFRGLPYEDANGDPISYTVKEAKVMDKWMASYSDVTATGTSPPIYSVTVTNTYRIGGPMLPSTGSAARIIYMISGAGIMLCTLIYASRFKRRRKGGSQSP